MLKILRKIPFLSTLKAKDLKEIYKISCIRKYVPGEAIFSKLEAANHMFIVISGRIKIFTRAASKKRKTFAYLEAGDFFGEMALLEGSTRSASAQAVDYSRLLVIRNVDFKRILISDHQLCYYLLRMVSRRLRKANEEIEGLLFHNILGRVSKIISDLAKKGSKWNGGALLKEHYSQQELADLVGTTREPLTRALSALRRAKFIEVQNKRYFVKDPAKLAALCGSLA